jgi:hypothetical protein
MKSRDVKIEYYKGGALSFVGLISLVIGLIVLLLGIYSAFDISGQFNAIGANFLGTFLAASSSSDREYTILLLLSIIIMALGFVLIIAGSIAIIMVHEKRQESTHDTK